jgi:hypothetical protein
MKFFAFAGAEVEPDFVSKSIMKAIGTNYSHVGIIIQEEGEEYGHIIDATGKGVCKSKVEDYIKDHELLEMIDITRFVLNGSNAKSWLEGNLGKDYSEGQFVGFKIPALKKLVGDGESELICSELCARFCNKHTTIDAFLETDPDFICPKTFIEGLKSFIKGNGFENAKAFAAEREDIEK